MSSTLLTVINVSVPCIISSGCMSILYRVTRNRLHGAGGLLLTTYYTLHIMSCLCTCTVFKIIWLGMGYIAAWCIHRCMVFYNNNAMVRACMRMYTHTVLCYLMMFRLEELGMGHFKRLVNSQHTGKMHKVHADVHTHKHPLQATPNISISK